MVAGKGANVSRLTDVGSAQDEATEVEQRARKRGGDNHPAFPPPADSSSLAGKGGGARIRLDRTAGGGWPFPSFSSSSSSFSFFSFSSIVAGLFEVMKMTTEEELAVAAAAVAAAPEAAPQSLPQ